MPTGLCVPLGTEQACFVLSQQGYLARGRFEKDWLNEPEKCTLEDFPHEMQHCKPWIFLKSPERAYECLPAGMYVHHVFAVSKKARRRHQIPES